MSNINIRNVELTDVTSFKMAALAQGLTLRDWVLMVLKSKVTRGTDGKGSEGAQPANDDAGGISNVVADTGQGGADSVVASPKPRAKVKRTWNDATVPVLQPQSSQADDLRAMQYVRAELGTGESDGQGPTLETHDGHEIYRQSKGFYCTTCRVSFEG